MAVWCHKLSVEEVIEAVPCDVNFTHVMKNVEHMITGYCLAIRHLINNHDKADRNVKAFEQAKIFIESVNN